MTTPLNASDMMRFHLTLRRRGISNQAVLRAMEEVPRDAFVEPHDHLNAWRDNALPIACGQTISQPFVVAYMTERLNLSAAHRVLEIGTGSGYQAAVLSRLVKRVVSVERFRTLAETARARLASLGYDNIDVQVADGLALPETIGTFDRIVVTAAVHAVPEALTERLGNHGLLIAPVGPPQGRQVLTLLSRTGAGIGSQPLLNVRFVPALPGIAQQL